MATNISGLLGKVENGGVNAAGKLTASEFNKLVTAVIELQSKDVWLSETEYDILVQGGEVDPDKVYHVYEDEEEESEGGEEE